MRLFIPATILSLTLFLSGCLHVPAQPPTLPSPDSSSGTTTSTTEIDTSDWQTYRNAEYGFGFRYPREWKVVLNDVQQRSPSSRLSLVVSGETPKRCADCNMSMYPYAINMDVTPVGLSNILNDNEESLQLYAGKVGGDGKKVTHPLPGVRGSAMTDIGLVNVYYFFNLDNDSSLFINYLDDSPPDYPTLYQTIVNTIRETT